MHTMTRLFLAHPVHAQLTQSGETSLLTEYPD